MKRKTTFHPYPNTVLFFILYFAKNRDFVFRVAHTTEVLIPEGIKVTLEKFGYQKVATLADSVDTASRDGDKVFRESLADNGVQVLTTETFQTDDTDFTTQLTRIKALNPDAIFLSAQHRETIRVLAQACQLGISQDTSIISFLLSIDEIQQVGDATEGVITFTNWVITADIPGNRAFIANYIAKYGMQPSAWAVYILAEAISNAQSMDSVGIRDALAEIKYFDTVLGQFSFDAQGDPIFDVKVLIVKDGELVLFDN